MNGAVQTSDHLVFVESAWPRGLGDSGTRKMVASLAVRWPGTLYRSSLLQQLRVPCCLSLGIWLQLMTRCQLVILDPLIQQKIINLCKELYDKLYSNSLIIYVQYQYT